MVVSKGDNSGYELRIENTEIKQKFNSFQKDVGKCDKEIRRRIGRANDSLWKLFAKC